MRKVASKNVFDTANVHAFRLEYCTPCTAECCRAYLLQQIDIFSSRSNPFSIFFRSCKFSARRWRSAPSLAWVAMPPLDGARRHHRSHASIWHLTVAAAEGQSQRAKENILALSYFCSAADFFQSQFLVCSFFFFCSLICNYTFVFWFVCFGFFHFVFLISVSEDWTTSANNNYSKKKQ